jgi:hypothetical protein
MIFFFCSRTCATSYGAPPPHAERGIWGISKDEIAMELVAEIMDSDSVACRCREGKESRRVCKGWGNIDSY